MHANDSKSDSGRTDRWASGELYQPYIGRWSRLVASEFLAWLGVPAHKRWLDVGCGTGALSRAILESASPAAVKGVDPSQGYIAYARDTIHDERMTFDIATAEHLPLPDASYDVVVSGLALNFVPDPVLAVAEMKRVASKAGTIGAYLWDYADKMELIRHFWDAAVELDQTAIALDEGRRFPLCRPEPMRDLFAAAGLRTVEIRPIDVPTRFENFDDYWAPFLGAQGPAPGYAMSLSEERREVLRNRIRSRLPVAADGSIHLTAQAWAVRGRTS